MNLKKYTIISLIFLTGLSGGGLLVNFFQPNIAGLVADTLRLDDQEATIRAINKVIPAVVNIIVLDQQTITIINLTTGEQTQKNRDCAKRFRHGFFDFRRRPDFDQ